MFINNKLSQSPLSPDRGFFTGSDGYISNIGSFHDPLNKAGLLSLTMELYKYGTKNYPKSIDLYRVIESLGSSLFFSDGRDTLAIGCSYPQTIDKKQVQDILDEILNEPRFSDVEFEQTKRSQLMKINELKSDDAQFALANIACMVLDTEMPLGTAVSLDNISRKDVETLQEKIAISVKKLIVLGVNEWSFEGNIASYKKDSGDRKCKNYGLNRELEDRVLFIERDLPQKVVTLGIPTKTQFDYNRWLRGVSSGIMYNGLVGLIPEVIREKHSAAYYAQSTIKLYSFGGGLFILAGVSEENVCKTISLSREVLKRVKKGDFEDGYVTRAKEMTKTALDAVFSSPDSLFSFYADLILEAKQVESYDSYIEKIDSVSKDEIVAFYSDIISENDLYLVVNGSLKPDVTKESKDLVKERII